MRELTLHHVEGAPATRVFVLDEPDENAGGMCHQYEVVINPSPDIGLPRESVFVQFQHGPIKEVGRNGLTNEALLAIVIDRLECAQDGPFACGENETALAHVNAALLQLQSRTKRRIAARAEGTNQKAEGDGHDVAT